MLDAAAENGLKQIISAIRGSINPEALKILESSIRTYGQLCGNAAVIEYLTSKEAA